MKLSGIYSDGMVLQRDARVILRGQCSSGGQKVQIGFRGMTTCTDADPGGNWEVQLEELAPGGPDELVITAGEEKHVLRDVLVGDVWVLAGQSNMELPVRRTLDRLAEEIRGLDLPMIRQFAVPQSYDFHGPQEDLDGGAWVTANPEGLLGFSAAGFFFAKEIYERYGVPIGLIQTAVGGTPIEAWISEPTLRKIGGYEATLEQCKDDAYVRATKQRDEDRNGQWYAKLNEADAGLREGWHQADWDVSEWSEFEVPGSWAGSDLESVRGAVWFRKEIDVPVAMTVGEAQLALGTIVDADDSYVNGVLVGNTGYMYPPRRYNVPQGVLKPGKNTLAVRVITTHNTGSFVHDMPYKLKAGGQELDLRGSWRYRVGAVTEALEPQTFFHYMPAGNFNGMIAPLRRFPIAGVLWYQGESNTGRPAGYAELFRDMVRDWREAWGIGEFPVIAVQLANFGPEGDPYTDWAELREEQRKGLAVPRTALATAIDLGEYNDLHPQDKKSLGQRLALCARRLAYGETELVASGPIFVRMERQGDALRLHFTEVGGGLTPRDGNALQGFSVCGPDGAFVPAQAVIDGDTVVVRHEQVKPPIHVRYAWSNNPAKANLVNREGLPAFPFTTETEA
ncbi:9-O-acetylesterase [Paenibacillus sp. J53TS2]|uniref:sialate O-acetylesterase n=1 Tax=Paenibacillus sp. J53TS2 TaxID=2807197 RepID=UPI001B077527|nr:sialate O-acetylesterase [Paenibacillus sp. J53TS2]GIP47755.1 9-O-acetylesterase [Paenibacillus sp. J53TS2]